MFWDKKYRDSRPRSKDDIVNELTKDVTSFLNSTGGRIIYGVLEKNSRADKLDSENPFSGNSPENNVTTEKVLDWIRAYAQPPPAVNVYIVVVDETNTEIEWFIVIEIPQGQVAYMAKDHRFYKRVSNTVRQMEQYEIIDVMNRTNAADLQLQVAKQVEKQFRSNWKRIGLRISVSSANFIASEYGAIKITFANPLRINDKTSILFRGSRIDHSSGLITGRPNDPIPHSQSIMIRWGVNSGNVILPGDWYDFNGNLISIEVPNLEIIPNPTYIFQIELFTANSLSKKFLYTIQEIDGTFDLKEIDTEDVSRTIESFWRTYHSARDKLQ